MPRDDPHRRTRARVRVMAYLMLDITYNLSHRPSPTYRVNPALDSVCADSPCKRSIWLAPLPTSEVGMTRISVGKLRGLQQISDDTGRFTMIAMDQRGSLQKMLHPDNPKAATYGEVEAVKLGVTEALAPHASGYLLDPEFVVAPAINRFALPGRTGLLVALEQSGYEKKGNWRLTTLLEGWTVEKVKRLGASAAKLLLFFNPDAPREIVDHQLKVVKTIADECRRLDLAFVCEPMSYPVDVSDEEFARKKADTIIRTAEALSPLGFDVLKAEFPGDPKVTPDLEELRKNCERLSRATKVPWVVLSAGATANGRPARGARAAGRPQPPPPVVSIRRPSDAEPTGAPDPAGSCRDAQRVSRAAARARRLDERPVRGRPSRVEARVPGGVRGDGRGEGRRKGAFLRCPRPFGRIVEREEQQHLRDDLRDL